MDELKSCPFCGGKAKDYLYFGRNAIACSSCGCVMVGSPTFTKSEEIMEKAHLRVVWNRRISEKQEVTHESD